MKLWIVIFVLFCVIGEIWTLRDFDLQRRAEIEKKAELGHNHHRVRVPIPKINIIQKPNHTHRYHDGAAVWEDR